MIPAPPGSEPGGFELGPEIWLLGLGVIATAVVLGVLLWIVRLMIREDREKRACDVLKSSRSAHDPREVDV